MPRRDLVFRVFVSSTFSDLKAERDALQRTVFPALRRFCRDRGARFQAIDLRWGVSREAALDQQTMPICFEELARCQEFSPRPNFIILLGNRYGWRPLPAQIEAAEFAELLARLPADDRVLLETDQPVPPWRDGGSIRREGWYRTDFNAVPAARVLQPRVIEYPPEATAADRARIREEEVRDWGLLEDRMRRLFRDAMDRLGWPADDPRRFKYEASATHQEIQAGALRAADPREHVLCYVREIDGLPTGREAAGFRDLADGQPDADAEARLRALKAELTDLLPPEHVRTTRAAWAGDSPVPDLDDLCERVRDDLQRILEREIAAFRQVPAPDRERDEHRRFAEARGRSVVGRADVLQRIRRYVESEDNRPLILHGQPGAGKTAVMAKAWLEMAGSGAVVGRFVGATAESADLSALLAGLCRELGHVGEPDSLEQLIAAFAAALASAGSAARLIVLLDGVDQIVTAGGHRPSDWLPSHLPANVRLIVSVTEIESTGMRVFDPDGQFQSPSGILVGPLVEDEMRTIVAAALQSNDRCLQTGQLDALLSRAARCPRPLCLELLVKEACRWRSWTPPPPTWAREAGPSAEVDEIVGDFLRGLEEPSRHGPVFVGGALGYLAASRGGLSEDELLDVLSADEEVMADFRRRSPDSPNEDRLPVIVWSRLALDLQFAVAARRAGNVSFLGFANRSLKRSVEQRYLTSGREVAVHAHLARYFRYTHPGAGLDMAPLICALLGTSYPDRFRERFGRLLVLDAAWHLAHSRQWESLLQFLSEPDHFLEALLSDPQLLLEIGSAVPPAHDVTAEFRASLTRTGASRRPDRDRIRVAFARGLAQYFTSAGRFEDAWFFGDQALTICRMEFGDDHPETAICLLELGGTAFQLARFEEGEALCRQAQDLLERSGGSDTRLAGFSFNQLGTMLWRAGRFGEAATAFRQAVRFLSADGSDGAVAWNNLGRALMELKQYDEAEQVFRQALDLDRRIRGSGHPAIASTLRSISQVCGRLERWPEAEMVAREALAVSETTKGPHHPETAICLNDLGVVVLSLGRFDEAEKLLNRACRILERTVGVEHPDHAGALVNLAVLHEKRGRQAEAEALYRRALAILQTSLGTAHPLVVRCLEHLALLYQNAGRLDEATTVMMQLLDAREQNPRQRN